MRALVDTQARLRAVGRINEKSLNSSTCVATVSGNGGLTDKHWYGKTKVSRISKSAI